MCVCVCVCVLFCFRCGRWMNRTLDTLQLSHSLKLLTLTQTPCLVLNSSQTCTHTLSSSQNQQATSCTSGLNAAWAGRLRKTRRPVRLQIQRNERVRPGMKRGILQRVGLWSRWSRHRTPNQVLAVTRRGKRRAWRCVVLSVLCRTGKVRAHQAWAVTGETTPPSMLSLPWPTAAAVLSTPQSRPGNAGLTRAVCVRRLSIGQAVWGDTCWSTAERRHSLAKSARLPSPGGVSWSDIWWCTRAKSLSPARNVRPRSTGRVTWSDTWWCTPARSHSSARSAAITSPSLAISRATWGRTQERSLSLVKNAERLSGSPVTRRDTCEFTLEKNPSHAQNAKQLSDSWITWKNTRRHTRERTFSWDCWHSERLFLVSRTKTKVIVTDSGWVPYQDGQEY